MTTRTDFLTTYLRGLIVSGQNLQSEKRALQNAAARIPAIDSEIADLRTDAQTALDKLNQLQGTSLTLADFIGQLTGAA